MVTSGVQSSVRPATRPGAAAQSAAAHTERTCPGPFRASHRRRLLVYRRHSRRAAPALRRRTRFRPAPALPRALRRLRGLADPDALGCRGGTPLELLASAASRRQPQRPVTHRPATTGGSDVSRRGASLHPLRSAGRRGQGGRPWRRRDAVHDVTGGVTLVAAPLQRPGRPPHRLTIRLPPPARAGAPWPPTFAP